MNRPKPLTHRRAEIEAWAAEGLCMSAIAERLAATGDKVSQTLLRLRMVEFGIKRNGQRGVAARARQARRDKIAMMAALYRDGYTLKQIGDQYGLTRERVRQLLTRDLGITAPDGGQSACKRRKMEDRRRRKEAACLKRWGCTVAQHAGLLALTNRLIAEGASRYRTPLYAFRQQKQSARQRGIGWELALWQWWQIWQQSGKWSQRGRGQGYVMARHGDVGPYAVGNVYITTAIENISTAPKIKKSNLPCGVRKSGRKKTGYYAERHIGGKRHISPVYPPPELAHAAYLMLGDQQQAAA